MSCLKMESVRCFICGIRIGRGNHTNMDMHERREKLISVSQTVEHSSTIISDILSRILNETVMRGETICKICFNLLNDIDYHLKEAQEKTDEITNKFLDKEKDPLSYRPQPIVTAEKDVDETTEITLSPHKQHITHNKENIGGDASKSSKRHHTKTWTKRKSKSSTQAFVSNDTDSTLTEDEMSVNMINKNKAKLLSHVLNPSKKLRKIEFKDSDEDEDDDEEKVAESSTSKSASKNKIEISKSLKTIILSKTQTAAVKLTTKTIQKNLALPIPKTPKMSRNEIEKSSNRRNKKTDSSGRTKKHAASRTRRRQTLSTTTSDEESSDTSQPKPVVKPDELTTVNMDDLTDLLSQPKVYFAKKSTPDGSRVQVPQSSSSKETNLENSRDQQDPDIPSLILQGQDREPLRNDADIQICKSETIDIEEKIPISCEICFKTFKRGTNLQLHKEKVHNLHEHPTLSNIPETHKCSSCPREFTNPNSLTIHQMEHEGISDEEVLPDKKLALNPGSAVAKAKSASSSEPKATCPICFKTFQRQFNLKTHINRVHEKAKPFVCAICKKTFATNSDLRQHIVVHGQGKMFPCETCGREFSNRDSIILHRKQHTQQRTHFCEICKKGFYKASCLKRHTRSHTGERPFKCDRCPRTFAQSCTLRSHILTCTGGKQDNDDEEEEDDDDDDD